MFLIKIKSVIKKFKYNTSIKCIDFFQVKFIQFYKRILVCRFTTVSVMSLDLKSKFSTTRKKKRWFLLIVTVVRVIFIKVKNDFRQNVCPRNSYFDNQSVY